MAHACHRSAKKAAAGGFLGWPSISQVASSVRDPVSKNKVQKRLKKISDISLWPLNVHTHVHTCTDTHNTHTGVHAHIHTHRSAHTGVHAHMHTQKCTHTHRHTQHTQEYTHTGVHAHIHTGVHTYMHTHRSVHTHVPHMEKKPTPAKPVSHTLNEF